MFQSVQPYKLILFLLFFFSHSFVFGQNNSLYVLDSTTKIPVQFAVVQSQDLKFSQTTDENGFVSLNKLPENTRRLVVSRVGFQAKTIDMKELITSKSMVYLQPKITSLSEVVINASANNGIFKTISDLDIHLRPINNSQEVLRMVPGLFIGQHAGGGKAEQIFLRGFDLDHGTDINISVDGMPVNMVSHAHGQGYADLHFVIPELIENVNFNKGPYFADKGNFTTAGFVEFKTKDYLENNFVKAEGGQFNTFRGIAGINLLKTQPDRRDQSLYMATEASYTKGYFTESQNFRRFNGVLKYHGKLSPNHSFSATATGFTSQWLASGQIPERAVKANLIGWYGAIDPNEGGQTSRYNANVELLSHLNNGATWRNQLYYSKYLFELYSNFTFYKEDTVNGDQIRQKENRNIWGYNSTYQHQHAVGTLLAETKAGVQVRYDDINNLELSRTKDRTINTQNMMFGDVRELNAAAYVSEKVSVTDQLDVTGALRFDYFRNHYADHLADTTMSSNSNFISPKLNFNYRLNDNLQLYWYNGRGFHSNDTRVAVQQNGKKVLPPAYGTDLGMVKKLGKKFFLQTAIWYLWLDQEFVYVGDEGVVEAGGQTRRFGLDVSARYEIISNLYADLELSLANPRALGVAHSESYLPLAPRVTSVGGLTYRQRKGWNGSLRYRYMADRPANETNTVVAEGYWVVDAAANYTTQRWEAGLSIQNLLNTKWKETQFDTESRLQNEPAAVSEIHFTAGTPFFARLNLTVFF
ncbi:Outer membrane receptor proteins, mostly Fe transport [Flexibacter flexilis DSM 6793]|uniref:Outer membrane receptor proteins, mostly Fe transport n=1 Tax=Flexibacter flexilis DSM 6793 TaxID=927664 RepID=A0A1I1HZQ8_9BACT|nr:TonB-dependent receptor [Flexibacter flexilis]SFC29386.1 Outer membrane receptor proteins, mostly Fe transport [Flexibacter flexilis DSM 6793]